MAFLAILASIFVIIVSIRTGGQREQPGTPGVTTLWPYGLPEYHVEVPEGYEDLLPGADGI